MIPTECLTSKEGQERLLLAYRDGGADPFRAFAVRPFLNPVEQRNEKNKRKAHPMLVVALLLLVGAFLAAWFFSR
jgi:hypothetical protein